MSGDYNACAWLVGHVNKATLALDKASIYSAYPVAQMGTLHHQVLLAIGYGRSYEEGKRELERRLRTREWSWITAVLR